MRLRSAIIIGLCLVMGILFYLWQNSMLFIALTLPVAPAHRTVHHAGQHTIATIVYWKNGATVSEQHGIIEQESVAARCDTLVHAWYTVLESEKMLNPDTVIESVMYATTTQELFISWKKTPFIKTHTLYEKWLIVESLLATLRHAQLPIKTVLMLHNGGTLSDIHLAMEHPWPLAGFMPSKQSIAHPTLGATLKESPVTILLDPYGDTATPGRTVFDAFERGLTLRCAEALKMKLEELIPYARVLISKEPGQSVEKWHTAALANKIPVDLCIALGMTEGKTLSMQTYRMSLEPTSAYAAAHSAVVRDCIPYSMAHLPYSGLTAQCAQLFDTGLTQASRGVIQISHTVALPCARLIGMVPPALYCEMCLVQRDDWRLCVEPIAVACSTIAPYLAHHAPFFLHSMPPS